MDKQREANYLFLLQRENEMEERAFLHQKELEKEKNKLRKSKEKILKEKRKKVENYFNKIYFKN